jgi:signal transduction histidine kinase
LKTLPNTVEVFTTQTTLQASLRPGAIAVTDSGPGIPKEIVDKIMQPFFTTKPVGKGTGLGLSLSAGIMQTHGGALVIDSSCANTKFILEFPIRAATKAENAA